MYKKIISKFIKENVTVATAESCTGGLLSYSFIKNRGVSKIFKTGIICYSNESKIKFLQISKNLIKNHGAVSSQVAKKMSENLFKLTNCNLCISVTGVAGPAGGSDKKPVGLVYIGIKYKKENIVFKKYFKGSRIQIQKQIIIFIFKKINSLI